MKLSPDYLIHKMDDKTLAVPTAEANFHGLVQGNKSVGVILECLEKGATEEEIVSVMCDRFDGDREEIKADVADVISRLREIGAIVD